MNSVLCDASHWSSSHSVWCFWGTDREEETTFREAWTERPGCDLSSLRRTKASCWSFTTRKTPRGVLKKHRTYFFSLHLLGMDLRRQVGALNTGATGNVLGCSRGNGRMEVDGVSSVDQTRYPGPSLFFFLSRLRDPLYR